MSVQRDHDVATPFLPGSRHAPWPPRLKQYPRRHAPFVKPIVLLAVALALAISVWLYVYHDIDALPSPVTELAESPPKLDPIPNHAHRPHHPKIPAQYVDSPTPTVNFALISWGELSASEAAILIKHYKSIMMHTSSPIHLHIICDEAARQYLEARFERVKHPRHKFTVSFYQLTWSSIMDRLAREGSMQSEHAAGAPGLLKLLIHEILPDTVKKAIFVDTDAIFISDALLLWQQFDKLRPGTAISMPSHPNLGTIGWHNADKICSCIILLNLDRLRAVRLIDSSVYREANDGIDAVSPPAFHAMFGDPDPDTGHYEHIALGDQTFWWAIISHRPDLYQHLSYDWEVTSCIVDTYGIGLGNDMNSEEDEIAIQLAHTKGTPHESRLIVPKMLHFNCIPGDLYYDWAGWDDPAEPLAQRWGAVIKYYTGHKWLWLNQASDDHTNVTIERIEPVTFADEQYAPHTR